eukprot:XP_001697326.1 predicted protein [Chlamydomonas reinhardtii]
MTFSSSGIGEETAAALVRRGANVVLACRSAARGEELKRRLEAAEAAAGRKQPQIEVRLLDLASLDSVRAFAAAWQQQDPQRPLHLLVNNAGVFTIGGISVTDPHLIKPGSYSADFGYAQSKLANILFTRELRRRLAAAGEPDLAAGCMALHPGLVCTGVARSLPAWMWDGTGTDDAAALWLWRWSAEQVKLPPGLDLPEPSN